ncbi:MAG TPA: amino acid ABC transporter permease [bacterium]|jgi:His/Glu/Gln/Arg/opine family amino acid ABC transporter permease subunit|nr:amino acid ABC transporter permease [bacterium]
MDPTPSGPVPELTEHPGRGRLVSVALLERAPWWALVLLIGGIAAVTAMLRSPVYVETYDFLAPAILVTLQLAVYAYVVAMLLGLIAALGQISKNPFVSTPARLYVEVIRGVPLLVQIIYIAFVLTPALADLFRGAGLASVGLWFRRDIVRAVLALGIGYGAYLAEVYRAGIQSIGRGQTEAARSLGMTPWQTMRYVVLPQAIRVILPPLGNDFVSMLKDSSLASVISVQELTYSGQLLNARTFRSFETYNMVALLYLIMTLAGSLGVRGLERWASRGKH